jgi:F0F1-type ATP synthase assembly protein I
MAGDRPSRGPRLPIGLMAIGSQMVGFTVLGIVLDYLLGSMPAFTIGLTLLGFVAAFVQLIRFTRAKFGPQPGRPPDGVGGPR